MVSGGARGTSGPPPDPRSFRQTSKAKVGDWILLPSEGRKAKAPAWPLPTMAVQARASERLLAMYEDVDLFELEESERKRIEKSLRDAELFVARAAERDRREAVLWSREWKRPQAVEWEKAGQVDEVALYVRRLAEAEAVNSTVALSTLIRQMREDLGISKTGMARMHWRIAPDEVKAKREQNTAPAPARQSSRQRFKVVANGSDGA